MLPRLTSRARAIAEVPNPVGQDWLRSEWVEPVDGVAKKVQAALDAEERTRAERLAKAKDASGPADEHGTIRDDG